MAEQPAIDPAFSPQPSALSAESDPESTVSLPPMEDLVKRIPMPTRDLMEELFRAKFITVKRIPQTALKG